MINRTKTALCYCLVFIFWLMTQACYFAPEESDPLETSDYMDYDEEDERESEDEKEPLQLEDPGWSLDEMELEEYYCFDDFYDVIDETEMFCRCLVEKVAMRWDYEQYKRREYTYLMRLNNNGTLERCLETPDFWHPESEEEVKEDQEFNAEPDKKELIDSLSQEE